MSAKIEKLTAKVETAKRAEERAKTAWRLNPTAAREEKIRVAGDAVAEAKAALWGATEKEQS